MQQKLTDLWVEFLLAEVSKAEQPATPTPGTPSPPGEQEVQPPALVQPPTQQTDTAQPTGE
jgi:hypothetical protein